MYVDVLPCPPVKVLVCNSLYELVKIGWRGSSLLKKVNLVTCTILYDRKWQNMIFANWIMRQALMWPWLPILIREDIVFGQVSIIIGIGVGVWLVWKISQNLFAWNLFKFSEILSYGNCMNSLDFGNLWHIWRSFFGCFNPYAAGG